MLKVRAPRVALLVMLGVLATGCASGGAARAGTGAAPAAAGRTATASLGAISRAEHQYLLDRRLMVPVDGVSPDALRDDFSAGRSGGRSHNAIDIMAPRFTPVLAVDHGRILSVRSNTLGGLIIYALDEAERFVYYYAHLDSFREGLRPGERIRAGDVIGYVGNTGNASATVPHLHLQIMRYQPRRYWEGAPVNPFPILQRTGEALPRE